LKKKSCNIQALEVKNDTCMFYSKKKKVVLNTMKNKRIKKRKNEN